MKCTIPEISWHNREPVLSVDLYPIGGDFYRLATGGGDSHVVIWQMTISDNGAVKQELLSDLTRHQRAVNCVRWSNNGQYLASADDDANIIVWQLKTDNIPLLEGETGDKEVWIVFKILRGHKEDVYDLCWSIDNSKLFSGSVDNTAILWDIGKGKLEHILTDHKGFVQGVKWDPKNQIIATISTDRTCRIFDPTGKHVKARIQKGKLNVPEDHHFHDLEVKFFHDDTFKSFFRRLDFTPDGSLLVVPSGRLETDNCKALSATLVFKLDNWHTPAVVLPIPHQSSTVVRCCPVLYELHENGPQPYVDLPYRMIFAVGTDHDIVLYDTQQVMPFARFQEIHYTRVTDLTWSHDGLLLVASSTDGFCSLITFELDELGVPYIATETEVNESILDISGGDDIENNENIDENPKEEIVEAVTEKDGVEEKKKRPSFLMQWAQNPPKKPRVDKNESDKVSNTSGKIVDKEKINVLLPKKVISSETQDNKETINKLVPRKIAPVQTEDKNSIENDKSSNQTQQTEETKQETKKRSSFLQQWAQNTPKRKKVDTVQPETKSGSLKSNKVIEIPDSPQKKDGTLEEKKKTPESNGNKSNKDKVNVLTPRRIVPIKVGEVTKTQDKINVLVPKRIKPVTVETTTETEKIKSDSEASEYCEKLSEQEQKEYEVASLNIQEIFCRSKNTNNKSNSHSDAKPIAIRRKPKVKTGQQSNDTKNTPQNNLAPTNVKSLSTENDKLVTKSSENLANMEKEQHCCDYSGVKSKENTSTKTSCESILNVETSKPKQCRKSDLELGKITSDDIGVKGKTDSKKVVQKDKSSSAEETTKSSSVRRKLDLFSEKTAKDKKCDLKQGNDIITLDLDENETSTKPVVKVKISSLVSHKKVPKEPKTPSQKSNALLNFLQKSTEKQKKTKKKKGDLKLDPPIDMALEEARDAWCENNKDEEHKEDESARKIDIQDDITEDFCLRLEESQDTTDDNCEKNVEKHDNTKKDLDNHHKQSSSNEDASSCKKTPRRIPLITVASPKNPKGIKR